ncbi:MAG: ethanolamine utilization protein EutH [Treponema sp.]|jgi:ethanolamine transporter|nr:ethanolamine utilization protein EutH [Treponema sp.]
MGVSEIILYIMLGFMVLGGIDYFSGKRFGLGIKYEEGFMAMGALTMNMAGAVCIAPVLGRVLQPVLAPVFEVFGASPAMFATTILANDMGGYPLAMSLAGGDLNAGNFAGLILGAMMGPTIVFSIPVGLGIIAIEDRPFLGKGILIGLCTIPFGCLAGGAVAGFNFIWMVKNLIPVIIFAAVIALGLVFAQKIMITIFLWFGRFVVMFMTLSLICAGIEGATGFAIIKGMDPISEAFDVVGQIAVVLAGAFVLVHVLTKFLGGPLTKLGGLLGMNKDAAAGMVATMANNIAMFQIMKNMDNRGKVINVAFAVSAAFVFGDHLGFTAGVNKEMIFPMVVGKLIGGITAVIVASIITPKSENA